GATVDGGGLPPPLPPPPPPPPPQAPSTRVPNTTDTARCGNELQRRIVVSPEVLSISPKLPAEAGTGIGEHAVRLLRRDTPKWVNCVQTRGVNCAMEWRSDISSIFECTSHLR